MTKTLFREVSSHTHTLIYTKAILIIVMTKVYMRDNWNTWEHILSIVGGLSVGREKKWMLVFSDVTIHGD